MLVLVPFWLLISMIIQLALASLARLTVEYAARVAARAAVVGAPWDKTGDGGDVPTAAAYPLLAVSPALDVGRRSVTEHLGGGAPLVELFARSRYAERSTSVVVTPPRPAWNDPITADVSFLYACQIPLADAIVCHRFADLPRAARDRFTGPHPGWYLVLRAHHTLINQGRPAS